MCPYWTAADGTSVYVSGFLSIKHSSIHCHKLIHLFFQLVTAILRNNSCSRWHSCLCQDFLCIKHSSIHCFVFLHLFLQLVTAILMLSILGSSRWHSCPRARDFSLSSCLSMPKAWWRLYQRGCVSAFSSIPGE